MPKTANGALIRRPEGPDPLTGLLTIAEAAELTGSTVNVLHWSIQQGLLHPWKRGRVLLLQRKEVEQWHASKQFEQEREDRNPLAEVVTPAEAAEIAGLSVGAVHYSIARGILPAWQRGALFLLPRAEVEAWHAHKQAEKAEREEKAGG